jgi:hypothetical protein
MQLKATVMIRSERTPKVYLSQCPFSTPTGHRRPIADIAAKPKLTRMSDPPAKEVLLAAVRYYDRCINDARVPEREVNEALLQLDALAPHSYITDLLHSAERTRTDEEAIDEALLRERLWHEQGQIALNHRLASQLTEALDRPDLNARQRHYCESMLRHLWGEPQ